MKLTSKLPAANRGVIALGIFRAAGELKIKSLVHTCDYRYLLYRSKPNEYSRVKMAVSHGSFYLYLKLLKLRNLNLGGIPLFNRLLGFESIIAVMNLQCWIASKE